MFAFLVFCCCWGFFCFFLGGGGRGESFKTTAGVWSVLAQGGVTWTQRKWRPSRVATGSECPFFPEAGKKKQQPQNIHLQYSRTITKILLALRRDHRIRVNVYVYLFVFACFQLT